MDLLRHEHGLTGTGQRFPRGDTLLDVVLPVGQHRAAGPRRHRRPSSRGATRTSTAILDLFRAYVARKRAQSLLDFDDLLLGWRALLADPRAGAGHGRSGGTTSWSTSTRT